MRPFSLGVAFLAFSATAVAQSSLAAQIGAMVAEPAVIRAHWGVMVTALDGTSIFALNEGQLFQPASNAKLFTTTAAVHLLGENRRFTTSVEGAAGATMQGDLTLRGGGDANFSGSDVPYVEPADRPKGAAKADPLRDLAEMADRVAATGLKHVTGDVVGDDTFFPWEPYAPDWAADDLVWGYGAPVSALTVMDSQLQLKVVAGARAGAAAAVMLDPAVGFYTLQTSVATVPAKTADAVQVDRALGSKVLTVSGTIAADSKVFVEEVAIDDPAAYSAAAFKSLLEARGVTVDGVARAAHRTPLETAGFLKQTREPLPNLPTAALGPVSKFITGQSVCMDACPLRVEHVSPTLIEDVVATNKESQNLHAELLLRQLGKAYGSDGSIAQGARVVRQFLLNAGLDKDDFVFYDGSGLSGHDLVTPRAVARLLQFATTQPWFADWRRSLPVGGVDGSLTGRFPKEPLKGHVFAKTGTLGEARALSGYVDCASGRTVIFSILVGNHVPGTSADRDVMDRIVAAIAAAN
ncbi:D-alanyl-D-alanine carboxypeptidase/D-alanyl-D-alanine endopeptidase [Granulicella arctica]|uniref:D-alanyl-D-alanine carboxypeptidase/D-alanyl-D-alanine endopeptidase n=1 Tax=Granulicella arctica TaxID=940613 RepID=UPI0021DF672D|nr:D-alanyl-D-alanine carboxypeptidase/D-alanyl-D-alanine-endopeptidase [Granulicella arctica]